MEFPAPGNSVVDFPKMGNTMQTEIFAPSLLVLIDLIIIIPNFYFIAIKWPSEILK
jgi:hypothetical protein